MRINNRELMNKYLGNFDFSEVFSENMKPFMDLHLYKRNEHICREGEDIGYLLFLVEGKAKVYTTLSNGKSLLLCFYQGFKVLGDLEIVNSQAAATTNVQAIDDAYCIALSQENAKKYLLDDPKFLRFICSCLGEKLDRCSRNSSINLLYPLENRLASYILAAGRRTGGADRRVIEFDENLSQIAELLGTSYRHLLRTFSSLCQKDILRKHENHYEVADETALKKLSSDLYR